MHTRLFSQIWYAMLNAEEAEVANSCHPRLQHYRWVAAQAHLYVFRESGERKPPRTRSATGTSSLPFAEIVSNIRSGPYKVKLPLDSPSYAHSSPHTAPLAPLQPSLFLFHPLLAEANCAMIPAPWQPFGLFPAPKNVQKSTRGVQLWLGRIRHDNSIGGFGCRAFP